MIINLSSKNDLQKYMSAIVDFIAHDTILLLNGQMGAGKTTFTKYFCAYLGVNDLVNSPTFSIVNEYKLKTNAIYHFDFYRIKDETEALDIGVEDYFYSGNLCIIEWSERIPSLIPDKYTQITMEVHNEQRTLKLTKHGI